MVVAGAAAAAGTAPSHSLKYGPPDEPVAGSPRPDFLPPERCCTEESPPHHAGPDQFGYVYADSRAPDGPPFDWVELRDNPRAKVYRFDQKTGEGNGAKWGVIELPFVFDFFGTPRNY